MANFYSLDSVPDFMLQCVFEFLPGHDLILALVCRRWHTYYKWRGIWTVPRYIFETRVPTFIYQQTERLEVAERCRLSVIYEQQWVLLQLRADWPLELVFIALEESRPTMVKWLLMRSAYRPPYLMCYVAAAGQVQLLEWMMDSGLPTRELMLFWTAMEYGQIGVLELLYARGSTRIEEDWIDSALEYGQVRVAEWLRDKLDTPTNASFI